MQTPTYRRRSRRGALAIAALLLTALCVLAKDAPIFATQKKPMNTFILLFRQNPGQLSEADLKLRGQQVTVWAQAQNSAGHKLDPRIFSPEGVHLSASRVKGPVVKTEEGPVTAALFIEAKDLDDAVKVAEGHPGLNFGATVEVRPWAAPVPPK